MVVSKAHTKLFSTYMDPYINEHKGRGGTTVLITVNRSPYNTPVFFYANDNGENATASLSRAVVYFYRGTVRENPRRNLYDACRDDIREQIMVHKKKARGGCSKCGENGKTETDHFPVPFCDLFNEAFGEMDIKKIAIKRVNGVCWSIADNGLRDWWQRYHRNHATMRELCVSCHRKHSSTQRELANRKKT